MITTLEQHGERAAELRGLVELARHPEWVKMAAYFREQHAFHLGALTDRTAPGKKRDLHLEAYHLARDLETRVPGRIAALRKELEEFQERQGASVVEEF